MKYLICLTAVLLLAACPAEQEREPRKRKAPAPQERSLDDLFAEMKSRQAKRDMEQMQSDTKEIRRLLEDAEQRRKQEEWEQLRKTLSRGSHVR